MSTAYCIVFLHDIICVHAVSMVTAYTQFQLRQTKGSNCISKRPVVRTFYLSTNAMKSHYHYYHYYNAPAACYVIIDYKSSNNLHYIMKLYQ